MKLKVGVAGKFIIFYRLCLTKKTMNWVNNLKSSKYKLPFKIQKIFKQKF